LRRTVTAAVCFATVAQAAEAQTLNACEIATDYKIAPLEAGAPASAAALQGVWVGSWDAGLCSALIVESIGKDGAIQAWYVYGRYSPWQIQQPGKARWSGRLSDKKMVFKGPRGGADYTLVGASQLEGHFYNNSGQYKGSFAKK